MLEYSDHALQRMAERHITPDEVESALRHATGPPTPGDNGNLVVFGYAPGQRILKIVLSADKKTLVSAMEVRGR
jgi:hypothetical protein